MIVYLVCYAASLLLALSRHYLLSGAGLLAAAVYLYASDYIRSGNLLHLRGIFALSFVGGQGLACMKLSYLSQAWSARTWLGLLAAFAGFYLAFYYLEAFSGEASVRVGGHSGAVQRRGLESYAGTVFFCAVALAVVSAGCFAIEAVYMGYIPLLLRGVPHAYSYFHVTGLHYLTVSCVLVPALSVIYFCIEGGRSRGRLVCMLLADAAAVAIPLLCVSRSQLLFAVLLALITYMQMEHQLNPIYVVFALAGLIMLYILLTIARSHDTAYLNTVFEMKRHLPIFVTQPYIYIANNYDNFDCLVKGLVKHSWGMKMLAPFWTLTGLKFLVPSLTAFPYYVTKEELTTLTMFYDAYYDFGVIGVFVFSALLGAAAYLLMRMMRQVQNPITYLLYAQFVLYMLLSFFTTWFSNPSTWFYFAVTAVVAFLVSHKVIVSG